MPFNSNVNFSSFAVDYTDHESTGANQSSYTFSSKNLGTPARNRQIVVGVMSRLSFGSSGLRPTVTANGVSLATELEFTSLYTNNARGYCGLFGGLVENGETGDVVVDWGTTMSRCGIGVWAVYKESLTTHDTVPYAGNDGVASSSLAFPAGGSGLVHGGGWGSSVSSHAWSGAGVGTERYDEVMDGAMGISGADINAAGTITLTVTGSDDYALFCAASWAS
jgi:hypothetical protein